MSAIGGSQLLYPAYQAIKKAIGCFCACFPTYLLSPVLSAFLFNNILSISGQTSDTRSKPGSSFTGLFPLFTGLCRQITCTLLPGFPQNHIFD
jgi:hypothetical protein